MGLPGRARRRGPEVGPLTHDAYGQPRNAAIRRADGGDDAPSHPCGRVRHDDPHRRFDLRLAVPLGAPRVRIPDRVDPPQAGDGDRTPRGGPRLLVSSAAGVGGARRRRRPGAPRLDSRGEDPPRAGRHRPCGLRSGNLLRHGRDHAPPRGAGRIDGAGARARDRDDRARVPPARGWRGHAPHGSGPGRAYRGRGAGPDSRCPLRIAPHDDSAPQGRDDPSGHPRRPIRAGNRDVGDHGRRLRAQPPGADPPDRDGERARRGGSGAPGDVARPDLDVPPFQAFGLQGGPRRLWMPSPSLSRLP